MNQQNNTPSLRFPKFTNPWEKKRLGEIGEINRGKSKNRPRDAQFLFGGKYPFIQTGEVKNAGLFLDTYTQTYSEEGLKQSKLWEEGTLCITIAANIAETTILKIKACFPDSIIGLIPDKKKATVVFIRALFDKYKIDIQKKSQGVAQANLNQEKLSKIEFLFPSLDEQKMIAEFLSSVDTRINQLKKRKELLEKYKKGVMQKIFSQKLRFKNEKGENYPDWQEKTLGEVANITTGRLDANAMVQNGEYRFYTCAKGYYQIDKYAFDTEALLVSGNGANVGYIHYYKGKFNAYQRTYVLDGFGKDIFYIKYYLEQFLSSRINSEKKEGNTPYIVISTLLEMPIKVPILEEQEKIAGFLGALDERIGVCDKEIEKMENWKKGLMQRMFC